jgi:hypothetical protein
MEGYDGTLASPMTLEAHEMKSQERFEKLKSKDKEILHVLKTHADKLDKKGDHMVSQDIESIGGGFGGMGGGGTILGLLLGSLINRNGGLFGGNGDGGGAAVNQLTSDLILSKLGCIEGAIPLSACQTQNTILEQTNELNLLLNQNNNSQLMATAGVKDAVNASASLLLQAGNQNTQTVITAINGLSSKIDQNTISELQSRVAELSSHGRSREVEVNVSQQVNQVQAQAQSQQQMQQLLSVFSALHADIQSVKQA